MQALGGSRQLPALPAKRHAAEGERALLSALLCSALLCSAAHKGYLGRLIASSGSLPVSPSLPRHLLFLLVSPSHPPPSDPSQAPILTQATSLSRPSLMLMDAQSALVRRPACPADVPQYSASDHDTQQTSKRQTRGCL
ncbi:hypothetical protein CDD81_7770 [Ophiocordyceps australis]|uniref:Uncharacterized protein n=1 Tax=Ophiocordyceps australis TaxID=1399860 RepID=A0A2C5Y2L2_9HYPO|nr:hypothetical protein CDD81_7770 [Ophiocordyceps australis]